MLQKNIRHSENLGMENCSIPSEIISALIAVGGSVLTFFLASLFSLYSRKEDFNQVLRKESLNRRFSFYEELTNWLPVENILKSIDTFPKMNLESYAGIFRNHFSEFAYFILRARLYASNEVLRELIASQEEYKIVLSKALADKAVYQSEVHLVEEGDDIFDSLLDLGRRCTDRIINIIAKEISFDELSKNKSKLDKKRNKKNRTQKNN